MKSKFKERKVQIIESGGLGGLAFTPFFLGTKIWSKALRINATLYFKKRKKEISIIIFITRNLFKAGPSWVNPGSQDSNWTALANPFRHVECNFWKFINMFIQVPLAFFNHSIFIQNLFTSLHIWAPYSCISPSFIHYFISDTITKCHQPILCGYTLSLYYFKILQTYNIPYQSLE